MKLTTLLSLLTASQLNLVAAQPNNPTVSVLACLDEEWHDCFPTEVQVRMCKNLPDFANDKITGFEVAWGCCDFYRQHGCKEEDFLFSAWDRAHSRLPPNDNDIISSLKCFVGAVST